jgi:ketosteroid isomerase-like protein
MNFVVLALAFISSLFIESAFAQSNAELAVQVREAENAFAKTMADRDLEAFASFVAEDAFFFGPRLQQRVELHRFIACL